MPQELHITSAVVFDEPEKLAIRRLPLPELGPGQVRVNVEYSGISTGTEKLLWHGRMPSFPGMGYPLVPGYETVGRIVEVESTSAPNISEGQRVFVSGAKCYGDINGLFGGAASQVVVDAEKVIGVPDSLGEEAILLALAATARHALYLQGTFTAPDLIVGHGVMGRLLARISMALGGSPPTVWETDAARRQGAVGYSVVDPSGDDAVYQRAVDVSGDAAILDPLIARLGRHAEIVLAGFYAAPLSFTFPPAFMREVSLRIAAEWEQPDLIAVADMVRTGQLDLGGLITHVAAADAAARAYPTAFSDPECLKMVLDWRKH